MDIPRTLERPDALSLYARWRGIIVSTEPVDRTDARAAIADLYRIMGRSPPQHVVVFDSPRQAVLAGRLLARPGRPRPALDHPSPLQSQIVHELEKGPMGGVRTEISRLADAVVMTPLRLALEETGALEVTPQDLARTREIAHAAGLEVVARPRRRKGSQPELSVGASFPFSHAAGVLAQLRFLQATMDGLLSNAATPFVAAVDRFCRACAPPAWLMEDIAILTERPNEIDAQSLMRAGSRDGAMLTWRDGFSIRARQGVILPAWIVEVPHKIRVADIESQDNVELRRLMLEGMGIERYLIESGAVRISEDETGILWQRTIPAKRRALRRRPPVTFVEVVNGTPEPDGTCRRYFLRVPPEMRSARQAVAWTYGLNEADYRPAIRT